jgi:hypothetical protein
MTILLLITLLFIKHFIVDFPLQKEYQWKNKGTYGHFGGILHAGTHGIFTLLILLYFTSDTTLLWLAYVDFWLHYHIDWAKMNLNKKLGYTPTNSEGFWILLGVDQLLHALTYILITGVVLL